jgi:tRNA(Phe) wybutosine-synthesizing methylase Tyw3
MKQEEETACERRGKRVVSQEYIWETFDSLFKTVHRQGRRVEELEARVHDLERRLNERAAEQAAKTQQPYEMPAERAA